VVKVRLDREATAISLLIVLGIRRDGQKLVYCTPFSKLWLRE
jgi:hypothetical protein